MSDSATQGGVLNALRAQAHQTGIGVRQLGKGRLLLTLLVLVLAVVIALNSWKIPFLVEAERPIFDIRQSLTAPTVETDDRFMMVVYNDETLEKTGQRSPVDRGLLAKALTRIDEMGAKAIGIDILIDQKQDQDGELIAAFKGMKTPVALAHASSAIAEDKIEPWQQQFLEDFHARIGNPKVQLASIILQEDRDGKVRVWGDKKKESRPRLPNVMVPQAKDFQDYSGSIAFRFPKFSDRPIFADVPIDTIADDTLWAIPELRASLTESIKGRYIFIGGHINDIDVFKTPIGLVQKGDTWGVDVLAHMVAQQLDNRLLTPISRTMLWICALLLVLAGAATAAVNSRTWVASGIALAQIAALIGIPFLLADQGYDTYGLPAFGWLVAWFLAFAAAATASRALGTEQRKFAQSALGKYLPRDIASQIMKDPSSLSLTGEKREIFVVFTDLEGFTKLSHAIEPEMVALLLNRYLDMLSDVVLKHGGTIDKFVGDAVVAFWGAPFKRPDDGERAVRAAIAMYEAGEEFRRTVPEGVPAIGKTRVGLHFGEAIVGNFGGEGRIQYTALGDSMNTAARLESANKQTKSSVLISKDAVQRSGLDIFRPIGRVVLRGRATPIDIFEPADQMDPTDRKAFTDLAEKAIAGDVSAVTALSSRSDKQPQDLALANFVQRLKQQDIGGYFVLD
jgi:adenylate cyclase